MTDHNRRSPCCADEAMRWLRADGHDPVAEFIRDELPTLLMRAEHAQCVTRTTQHGANAHKEWTDIIAAKVAELRKP